MSAFDLYDLKDLFGRWSSLAFMTGLVGAFLGYGAMHRSGSAIPSENKDRLICGLPWAMGAFSAFLELWLVPASMAGGGGIERSVRREIARFDIYFAALIAFTFGFAFALDALRVESVRRRESAWLCVVLYCFGTLYFVFAIKSHGQT